MTQKIDLTAKKFASADTEIVSVEPNVGPESIEGFYDEAFLYSWIGRRNRKI